VMHTGEMFCETPINQALEMGSCPALESINTTDKVFHDSVF
jgi:hypothetical protein